MPSSKDRTLGDFLKSAREAARLTLREVEAKTDGRVKNGYLSQIENHQVVRPSPNILWELAELYGLDYAELLRKAGHRVPEPGVRGQNRVVPGIPLSALRDLDEEDRSDLLEYLAFLKQRKKVHGHTRTAKSGGR